MANIAVLGAGGFIGHHLVRRLRQDGHWVRGADRSRPKFSASEAHEFVLCDLRDPQSVREVVQDCSQVYQLAAQMGGAGYIFTGHVDAQVLHTSALINLNVAEACRAAGVDRVFFSSSACIYPQEHQTDRLHPICAEDTAYPANPDSEYGWEKLFSERLYLAFHRNYDLPVRIARFHSIVGPEGTWTGGKEKVFAALCRKVAETPDGGTIQMWGDGEQTRTFLYIEDCLDAIQRLMASEYTGPFNIGSDELVSINELAQIIMVAAGKVLQIDHQPGPLGVRGRRSDNRAITAALGWIPQWDLVSAVEATYPWIRDQVKAAHVWNR